MSIIMPPARASNTPYTPADTGAVTRTVQSRLNDTVNVRDFGAVGDGSTDDAAAFQSAVNAAYLAGGKTVFVPDNGIGYAIGTAITVPSGVRIEGQGKPLITKIGTSGQVLILSGKSNVEVRNLRVQCGAKATGAAFVMASTVDAVFENVDVDQARTGWDISGTSTGNRIRKCSALRSAIHGAAISGVNASGNEVSGCRLESLVEAPGVLKGGFGVILSGGANSNIVSGNYCLSNGIELVGITQDAWGNQIIGNRAENTGDNGISVTGFANVIVGNTVKGCQGNGINLYGERNTCTGNTCINNAKGNAVIPGWCAGILVSGGFGGASQYNIVADNVCDDDQSVPTQLYGVGVYSLGYSAWSAGQTITVGSYRYQALNLYRATTAGTAGASAPVHTSGTVTDGGVSWAFVRTFLAGTTLSDRNIFTGNQVIRYGTGAYLDISGASNNEFTGGFRPINLPSPLVVSQIANPGAVTGITVTNTGQYVGGVIPTITIDPPASGGQQALAHVSQMAINGFGAITGNAGSGYTVNDVLTLVGTTGSPGQIRVTAVDGSGAIVSFTGIAFGPFTATPSGVISLSGGTGAGAALTGVSFRINAVVLDAGGSNYASIPTVTFQSGSVRATGTAALNSSIQVNAGNGNLLMNSTGTTLGTAGSTGAPVISLGALIDKSGVRQSLGTTYTVPANTSLVRFTQASTVATSTVTLPTALADGQHIQFVNYAGAITALTFSPAVNGWTNGTTLAAYTGARVRWDATSSAWFREQ